MPVETEHVEPVCCIFSLSRCHSLSVTQSDTSAVPLGHLEASEHHISLASPCSPLSSPSRPRCDSSPPLRPRPTPSPTHRSLPPQSLVLGSRATVPARASANMGVGLLYSTTTGNTETVAGYLCARTPRRLATGPGRRRRRRFEPRLRPPGRLRSAWTRSTSRTPRTSRPSTASSSARRRGTPAPTRSARAPPGTTTSTATSPART